MDDTSYEYLKRSIHRLMNIDLENYKSQQMRRRLNMFFDYSNFNNVVAYVAALQKDPILLAKLRDFLTINVSEFFRDRALFDYLSKSIIPELLQRSPALTVWSAGCSRGEEPYSLAMILNTVAPGKKHRILATDIDDNSLAKARNGGPYHVNEIKDVPANVSSKYMSICGNEVIVNDQIKSMVEIKRHDLLNDPFERNFDLIVCRNVVIYFTEKTKRSLNERFHASLKPKGILFIGGTEVMLESSAIGFSQISPFFYSKGESMTKIPAAEAGVLSARA